MEKQFYKYDDFKKYINSINREINDKIDENIYNKKNDKEKIKIILDDIYYFNNYKFEENINFNGDLILKLNSKKICGNIDVNNLYCIFSPNRKYIYINIYSTLQSLTITYNNDKIEDYHLRHLRNIIIDGYYPNLKEININNDNKNKNIKILLKLNGIFKQKELYLNLTTNLELLRVLNYNETLTIRNKKSNNKEIIIKNFDIPFDLLYDLKLYVKAIIIDNKIFFDRRKSEIEFKNNILKYDEIDLLNNINIKNNKSIKTINCLNKKHFICGNFDK